MKFKLASILLLLMCLLFVFTGCHKKDNADSVKIDDTNKTQYSVQPAKEGNNLEGAESITTTTTTQPVTTTTQPVTTTTSEPVTTTTPVVILTIPTTGKGQVAQSYVSQTAVSFPTYTGTIPTTKAFKHP